jgi:thioester reductase-like protein
MSYFVTGATGFIGRYLVGNLLKRNGTATSSPIYVLVRKDSQKKFDAIAKKAGWDMKRISVVHGDMTLPKCGLTPAQLRSLSGKVKHFFHLAAIYDLTASPESQKAANIDGTQHALDLAAALKAGTFHHTSSIAAAGLYPGVFREDMFEEAEGLDDPYLRTKHDAESLVRRETRFKWRIYRPGMVVGSRNCGKCCRNGCRCWASKAAASISCQWISWPTPWTTSRTNPSWMAIPFISPIRNRCEWARCSTRSAARATHRK